MSGHIHDPGSNWKLNWSVSHRSKHSGQASGDGYLICQSRNSVLFAVSDGSGSGQKASGATEVCLAALGQEREFDLETEFQHCHDALKGSRGVALGIVIVDFARDRFSWAAVGDIDGMLLRSGSDRPNESMIQCGGVLGISLPRLHEDQRDLRAGDVILLTSDGIRRAYRRHVAANVSSEQMVAEVMDRFAHPNDDSIALAIAVGGTS